MPSGKDWHRESLLPTELPRLVLFKGYVYSIISFSELQEADRIGTAACWRGEGEGGAREQCPVRGGEGGEGQAGQGREGPPGAARDDRQGPSR